MALPLHLAFWIADMSPAPSELAILALFTLADRGFKSRSGHLFSLNHLNCGLECHFATIDLPNLLRLLVGKLFEKYSRYQKRMISSILGGLIFHLSYGAAVLPLLPGTDHGTNILVYC
ncbi:hypothetical protein Csa_002395 [Cucumis sativus]|nr:hypothetical protein Csa_002395 [Cucumis sativus]